MHEQIPYLLFKWWPALTSNKLSHLLVLETIQTSPHSANFIVL